MKLRLAQRKKQLELKRSGFLDEDDNKSTLSSNRVSMKQHPQSTRSFAKQLPRFGGFANGMLAELGLHEEQSADKSVGSPGLVDMGSQRPMPFSTKARD